MGNDGDDAWLPNQIGSLTFCSTCGNLFDLPRGDGSELMRCAQCGETASAKALEGNAIITRSTPSSYPSSLRQKRMTVKTDEALRGETNVAHGAAMIDERCPRCDNAQMRFNTVQLRSADEGSTVFYTCPKCSYKYSTNN